MNNPTPNSTKQFIDMALVMVVVTTIFCVALYQYTMSHNTNPQTVAKLNKQLSVSKASNKVLSGQNGVLSAKDTQLTAQKAQFCTELVKAKVTEPLCSQ